MSKIPFNELTTLCRQYHSCEGLDFDNELVVIHGYYDRLADTYAALLAYGHRPTWRKDGIGHYLTMPFSVVDLGIVADRFGRQVYPAPAPVIDVADLP